jgi:hypothetical protein
MTEVNIVPLAAVAARNSVFDGVGDRTLPHIGTTTIPLGMNSNTVTASDVHPLAPTQPVDRDVTMRTSEQTASRPAPILTPSASPDIPPPQLSSISTHPAPSPNITSATGPAATVPLDSSLRTTPLHPLLPNIKTTPSALEGRRDINPLTLAPFSPSDLDKYGYNALRNQILSSSPNGVIGEKERQAVEKMKEEMVREAKSKLEDREKRAVEVEREIAEKEKTREFERRALRGKLGGGKDGG